MHVKGQGIAHTPNYLSPVAKLKRSQWECHSLFPENQIVRDSYAGDELGGASTVNICGQEEKETGWA